jgi:4-hydroxyphenylpyruvate dioxygenase-like putative hemolysin
VNSYAKAAYAIEVKRTEVWKRALGTADYAAASQKATAKGVTICDMTKEEQAPTIQALCKELFNFAEQERRRNGFEKNSDFNQMTRALQQDSLLQERIRRKIAELSGSK